MAQAKKAKERKDIRDMDKSKSDQSSAMSARNMVQAIRNMYNSAGGSSSSRHDRGGPPQREGDRPEWASAMSNKDYYRTSQSTYTCSSTIREQKEGLPIFGLKDDLQKAIMENRILVVIGETGSGKTTQMPQYLYEMGLCRRGLKVGCT